MLKKPIKLVARGGRGKYASKSFIVSIGRLEAESAGLLNSEGLSLPLQKTIEKGKITISLKEE